MMDIWNIIIIFTAIIQLHISPIIHHVFPTQTSVLASTSHVRKIILPTPSVTITISPSPTVSITSLPKINKTLPFLVDCVGPDNKHLQVTQKQCDSFNEAWHHAASTNTLPTNSPWGMAKQIGPHTYTITVGTDSRMATASEIVNALNNYRNKKGIGSLAWDTKLGTFAQSRSDSFASAGKLDQHAGFKDYLNNQDGFNKLGFGYVGENASFTGPLIGVHLIEWVFAGDQEHDANQLNTQWTHVGIGVHGGAVDLVFGGQKK